MLGRITFAVETPCSDEELRLNVAHCLARGLPELRDFEYPYESPLLIVANGPSALEAPLETSSTMALNGALKLFTDRGLAPTFWAGCDPQEHLANFLTDAPPGAHYLVASKCHPKVFDTLLSLGRRVTVWHLDDEATWDLLSDRAPVSIAPTITICAFELAQRLGWRAFETWGWDGCLMDGINHASGDVQIGNVIELEVVDRVFQTTGSWALEAQQAAEHLADCPWPISICGGGMIGAIMQLAWAPRLAAVLKQREEA